MKKLSIALVFICCIAFAGCGAKDTSKMYILQVTVSEWIGWESNCESIVGSYEFDVKQNEEYSIEAPIGVLIFKIKNVSEGKIVIRTNEIMNAVYNSGANLGDNEKKFTINEAEAFTIVTPTQDWGVYYEFMLIKKEEAKPN